MNKTWIEARNDGTLDTMPIKDCKKLVGFVYPIDGGWEVCLGYGNGYTCESQWQAEMIAHQAQTLEIIARGVR